MGKLQIILLLISIVFFFKIIRYIKKSKLTTDLAIIWILWGCGLIVISLLDVYKRQVLYIVEY